ncbi:MAG TPA: hypothetical protein VI072_06680 [Polyangiaceae bacterium]
MSLRHLWSQVPCAAAALAVLACTPNVPLRPVQAQAEAPQARVRLTEIDGNILKFHVFNLTNQPLVILRDEIYLVTPRGPRRREAGGISNLYNVVPGGAHDVNVKFDFSGLAAGDALEVRFDRALMLTGRPVPIAPLTFIYE